MQLNYGYVKFHCLSPTSQSEEWGVLNSPCSFVNPLQRWSLGSVHEHSLTNQGIFHIIRRLFDIESVIIIEVGNARPTSTNTIDIFFGSRSIVVQAVQIIVVQTICAHETITENLEVRS